MLGRAPVQCSFLLHDADIPVASGVGLSVEGSERAVKHSLPGDSLDGHVHCEVQRGLVHEGAVRRRLQPHPTRHALGQLKLPHPALDLKSRDEN
eukprot:2144984-Rhodomonas_salina.1